MSKKSNRKTTVGVIDETVLAFTAGKDVVLDLALVTADCIGSAAHVTMLSKMPVKPRLFSKAERDAVVAGLVDILRASAAGRFKITLEDQDVHLAVERTLTEKLGDLGKRIHTGRSRNDQVALDIRLYLRAEIGRIIGLIQGLKAGFVELAKKEMGLIVPGYTHMQKAQPVLLSHYLLAFREMFDRDEARLRDCLKRVNVMPLGAAALAGTGLPIDRRYVAKLLKFPAVTENSMDAVSDRDFVAEFIFASSLLMMHMSRFCEDLVLWSGDEFGYVEIADAFTTGSSIMPQKKNPDVAELIRGKTGRVYGNLVSLLTILKGLPMTYNRDLQEDKEPLFDTVDTVAACLGILTAMIGRLTYNRKRMEEGAGGGFATATDVAEYLVMKGVPFREAHGIVGRIVSFCIQGGKELTGLTLREYRRFYEGFDRDLFQHLTVRQSVNARKGSGGTAEETVRKRIAEIGEC
jgi:argininosuccinate lyase